MLNLAEVFKKFDDNYIKFERIENKLNGRLSAYPKQTYSNW